MAETPKVIIAGADNAGPVMAESAVNAWFVREVLPMEKVLMQFLRHHWPNEAEIEDLRQEVYVRVYEAAQEKIPIHQAIRIHRRTQSCYQPGAPGQMSPLRPSPISKNSTSPLMRPRPTGS